MTSPQWEYICQNFYYFIPKQDGSTATSEILQLPKWFQLYQEKYCDIVN
jgi:hypothetical protein